MNRKEEVAALLLEGISNMLHNSVTEHGVKKDFLKIILQGLERAYDQGVRDTVKPEE